MPPAEKLRPSPLIKVSLEIYGPPPAIIKEVCALIAQGDEERARLLLSISLRKSLEDAVAQISDGFARDLIRERLNYLAVRQ